MDIRKIILRFSSIFLREPLYDNLWNARVALTTVVQHDDLRSDGPRLHDDTVQPTQSNALK